MSNPILARFAGEAVLFEASLAGKVEACLTSLVQHPRFAELASIGAQEDFWQEDGGWCRPYVVQDGILQIPVKGVLLHDFPYAFYDYATGYDYIWQAFKRGCGDYATGVIKGIALICDTPGGQVAGCFDARDRMIAMKEAVGVPVAGFAQEYAYSAGYAMITVADPGRINVSRTGGVGSIGVVTSHVDLSGMYDQMGVKITFIASDPSKVEGNATQAPSAEFLARTQARIDELYSIFVSAVARSRGLSEDAIRNDLKAYTYTATQATSNGLADTIGTLEDALSAYAGSLDEPSDTNEGDDTMADEAVTTVDQAVHEQAVATARAEGAAAMQERIGAILGSEEAKGRDSLAQHFAFKTNMSADDARAALAAAPVAQPEKAQEPQGAAATTLADAMANSENPDVGASAPGGNANSEDDASDVLALAAKFGVKGFVSPNAK